MELAQDYVERWRLRPDGAPVRTATSDLVPVRTSDGLPAMLKIARIAEEVRGNALMAWWAGSASARVFAQDGATLLLERAMGPRSLLALAATDDDAATRVLTETAMRLHSPAPAGLGLVPLRDWFTDLTSSADPMHAEARRIAIRLLGDPRDEVVLHGDLHHENVLDFGDTDQAAWKAIDPKGLVGESGFDYANLLCNPDGTRHANHAPARLHHRIGIVAAVTGLPFARVRDWHTAWHALSSIWSHRE